MNKQDIENEAIKYCSNIDFSNDKNLNEKGRIKVSEWCKEDFVAGAEWMQEQLQLLVFSNKRELLIAFMENLTTEDLTQIEIAEFDNVANKFLNNYE